MISPGASHVCMSSSELDETFNGQPYAFPPRSSLKYMLPDSLAAVIFGQKKAA